MGSVYKQQGGQFHLYNEVMKDNVAAPELTHASAEVLVAWCRLDDGRVHVFTHGDPDRIYDWVKAHNKVSPHTATLKAFDQTTPLDVLNQAISDPTFFATLVQETSS